MTDHIQVVILREAKVEVLIILAEDIGRFHYPGIIQREQIETMLAQSYRPGVGHLSMAPEGLSQ